MDIDLSDEGIATIMADLNRTSEDGEDLASTPSLSELGIEVDDLE